MSASLAAYSTNVHAVRAGRFDVRLTLLDGTNWNGFAPHLTSRELEDGRFLVTLTLQGDAPNQLPPMRLEWRQPIIDIAAHWHSGLSGERGITVAWGAPMKSMATSQAPAQSLYAGNGENRLTFAWSDALEPVAIRGGVEEETADLLCSITLFQQPSAPTARYEAQLLLDARPIPYHQALRDVSRWWAAQPGYAPASVPDWARRPMLSTWYSFHQQLEVGPLLEQCRLSREFGCEAVIVDDGWQTLDNARGYAFCGDWRPERIPQMREFVVAAHETGLKVVLWYAVPFVGSRSRAWERFRDKLLFTVRDDPNAPDMPYGVLDPRFPEVREFLISTFATAMRDWNLDGFKLDFVDTFQARDDLEFGSGRDYDSVLAATDRLLTDTIARLRELKPDAVVEFRQSYIGPLMRKYGNAFRAGDCPNSPLTNRLRTLDVRLLCDTTACHADMLMWHPQETPENVALHLLNVLFSVPQLSVKFDQIPETHRDVLRFWMNFWTEHRAVLLDGELEPLSPQSFYPLVRASSARTRIVAVYEEMIANIGANLPPELILVNATRGERLVLETDEPLTRQLIICDCAGRVILQEAREFEVGVHRLAVPSGGLARLATLNIDD